MFKLPFAIAALTGLALMSSAVLGHAQESATSFAFSTELQTSFEAMDDAKSSLRAEIDAATEGLTREEAGVVLETYADQVTALHDAERALRDKGVAEMEAAGVDVPERNDRGPEAGAERGHGGDHPERGGEGGQPGGDRSGGDQGLSSN